MKNPKTIENYLRRKMRLEALLAVVQHKVELVKIIRTAPNLKKAEENLISHFSLTSEQVQYLLNADVGFLLDSEYADVQKKYNQVAAYLTKHNNDTSIMSKNYTKGRWAHLAKYAEEKGMPIGGTYNYQGTIVAHDHILKIEDGQTKFDVVKKHNVLEDIDRDLLTTKLHRDAHHLNSSQILCYNFFRPYIDENGGASQSLVDLLLNQGISIEQGAKCTFEYTDNLDKMEKPRDKPTEFDFHIIGRDVEVFFEIKYTEDYFGGAEKNDNHKEKYELVYKSLLEKAPCLNHTPEFEEFAKLYQLYRNAIRITDKNKHLILLYPKNNTTVNKEATTFLENKIREEYRGNIHILHWEDIVKEGELYKKYFAE